METHGRSPLKDVVRSVVMSAGMISPALLGACKNTSDATPPPRPPDPPTMNAADASGIPTGQVPPPEPIVITAPPPEVVRPRTPTGNPNSMPTRGFRGGARRGV